MEQNPVLKILSILTVIFLVGVVGYLVTFLVFQRPLVGLESEEEKVANSEENLQIYRNEQIGFEFSYPSALGDVVEEKSDRLFTNGISFLPRNSRGHVYLSIFTDESVENFNQEIARNIDAGLPIGDPYTISYPLDVKFLLLEKEVGYVGKWKMSDFTEFWPIVDIEEKGLQFISLK